MSSLSPRSTAVAVGSSASTVSTNSTSTTHGQNELVGWLTEANQRKFYRLRGAELARFGSETADAHEKRAKIVGCALTRTGEASCTLSHPRWPKAWSVQADSAAQIKLWMHAFVVAGARKPVKPASTRSARPPPLPVDDELLRVDAMIPDDFVEEPPVLPPDSAVVVDEPPAATSTSTSTAPRRKSSTLKASPAAHAAAATSKTSVGSAVVKSSSPKASDAVLSPRKGGSSIKSKPTASSDDAAVGNSLARKGKSATLPDVTTTTTTAAAAATTVESSSTVLPVRTDSSGNKSAVPATVDASSSVTSTRANGGALSPRPDREAPKPSVIKAKASATASAPAVAAAPDAAIVSLELDRVHLVELFQDDSAMYFKTKGNSEETPNVQMPKQASSDGAEYTVSKGKTFPLSVCVVGRSDELSLSLVVNGEKLKFGAQWTLNGQEVRDHKTDAGQKATVVTLFVAIKFFEPPVSRVFMTARIKNTTAQRRIVVDVVQKVREAPPPVVSHRSTPGAAEARNPAATLTAAKAPAVSPAKSVPALASPATAAATTPIAAASAPAKPAAVTPAKSVPALTSPASPAAAVVVAAAPASASATAPRTDVKIPLDELERVSATDDTTLYLARVAKASGATGWNVRCVGAQFSVRLGVPFPLRVAVGAAATELSVSLMGATKLKNGRDWRLHSQTRTGDGVDTVLLLNVVIVNASADAPVTVNVALGGATRASMIVHILPAAAAAAAAPAAGLPPGWIEAQTPDKRVYYFNKALNKTSWVKPTVLAAAAVAATKRADDDDDDDDGAAAAPLPPNWRATANADGRLYFFNVVTKETTWKRPTAAAAPVEAAAPKVGTQYASSSVLDDAAPTAGGDGSDSSEGMGMVGLAMAGPEALLSDDDDSSVIGAEDLKAPNFMTLSDVRAKPVSLHDSDSFDGSRSDDDNDAGTRLLVQPSAINNRFDTWVGGAEKSSDDEAEAATLEKTRTSTSEAPSTSSPPGTASGSQPLSLPPALANKPLKAGWKAAVSSSGKTYWYHRASGQTTWVCPVEGEEQVELPPDWKQATSSSGQSYFYNARTKETTWVRPTAGPVAPTLPKGWKEAKAADGRSYFFNAKGVTRWQMPTEAADE
jgi:hypothetical protein